MDTDIAKLEQLTNAFAEFTVNINDVPTVFKIKQIKVGKIPKVLRAAGPLLIYLTDQKLTLDVPQMAFSYPDNFLELAAVLLDKDRAVIDELEIDDAIQLVAAVVQVNMDFFVLRVLPKLSGGIQSLIQKVQSKKVELQALAGKTPQPS